MAIGAVIAALGSSTLIGFLTDYATFNYAVAYGVRLPTESVPYLAFATSLVSLLCMLSALATFGGAFAFRALSHSDGANSHEG